MSSPGYDSSVGEKDKYDYFILLRNTSPNS
jgi:hypothetical protein